jgi:hypothetical protein
VASCTKAGVLAGGIGGMPRLYSRSFMTKSLYILNRLFYGEESIMRKYKMTLGRWLIIGTFVFGVLSAITMIVIFWQSLQTGGIIIICLASMGSGFVWGYLMHIFSGIVLKIRGSGFDFKAGMKG